MMEPAAKYENYTDGLADTHVSGAVTELRALNSGSVMVGHYTDLVLLFHYALELNGKGYATYACINPLRPECVFGLNDRPAKGTAAGDKHISSLRYLVYDVDPVRRDTAGKQLIGVAATDAEKESARKVAVRVYDFYLAQGVFPVFVDSGNGFYVLVPIALEPEERFLCAALLARHAAEFNTNDAEIDQSCSNPSRILRIPGTQNCKGTATAERPHRICAVLFSGSRERVLTAMELQQLVPEVKPPEPMKAINGGVDSEAQWMECFLEHSEILHEARQPTSGGGYKWLLEPNQDYCPNHSEHTAEDLPTTLAVFVLPDGRFGMRCHHGHCSEINPNSGQNKVSWKNFRAAAEARNIAAGRQKFELYVDDFLPEYGYWIGLKWSLYEDDFLRQQDRLPDTQDDLTKFRYTDSGNAERLVGRHGKHFRYLHDRKAWLHWDGRRWNPDQTAEIYRAAKEMVRAMYVATAKIDDPDMRIKFVKWVTQSESRGARENMVALAQKEEDFSALSSDFDTNPMLLNVLNGTIDLKTFELRPHLREDLLTKICPVRFDAEAKCPRWLAFLQEIFPQQPEVIEFLQRSIGYSLTGDTEEQCFWLLIGVGKNGKSKFLDAVQFVLGDYAVATSFDTFAYKKDTGPISPRDGLASLVGSRFVRASESDHDKRLSEAQIKALTGGERIRTARMYQDDFDYNRRSKSGFLRTMSRQFVEPMKGFGDGLIELISAS